MKDYSIFRGYKKGGEGMWCWNKRKCKAAKDVKVVKCVYWQLKHNTCNTKS